MKEDDFLVYIIRNDRRIRRKTQYIILTHSRNLIEDFYINPKVIQGYHGYTWGLWQKYFIKDLQKDLLPCHYFAEYLENDYVIYKGLGDVQYSYFLEDLVSASIIPYQYLNSILIDIGIDFSLYIPDNRLYEHLADKLICPLIREYKLDFTRVKYIDDCLNENWEENLKNSTLKYKYTKAQFFDFNILKLNLDKYKK